MAPTEVRVAKSERRWGFPHCVHRILNVTLHSSVLSVTLTHRVQLVSLHVLAFSSGEYLSVRLQPVCFMLRLITKFNVGCCVFFKGF